MRGETYPRLAAALELDNIGGVQAGGAGARVDLGAQARHAKVRQGDPFFQADDGEMIESLQKVLSAKGHRILAAQYDNRIRG
ncbi:hypothetical protein GCM10017655_29850 [Pseudomonas turukhanskensis]|uniref:Uncharacterized protein n=1 Tax=Pseudomonas turukhanskensis TaxID=1806536 RepID=A0A9W6NGC5_9PSED|nr:hypothetical protein GCM10017655_29850 [Pseudomonas turukhanskensis]